MAAILNIDPDAVVGKLVRLWIWADQQSLDGNALSVTDFWIDRFTYCPGFAAAMREAGWLDGPSGAISFPNFARHNGKTAKKRSLTNDRVAKHRQSVTPKDAIGNAASVTSAYQKALPDEDEDIPTPNGVGSAPAKTRKRGTRLPRDWTLPDDWRTWAETERPDVDVRAEAAMFRDYWIAKSGTQATKLDWEATWRNWIRKAHDTRLTVSPGAQRVGSGRPVNAGERNAQALDDYLSWIGTADQSGGNDLRDDAAAVPESMGSRVSDHDSS